MFFLLFKSSKKRNFKNNAIIKTSNCIEYEFFKFLKWVNRNFYRKWKGMGEDWGGEDWCCNY